MALLNSKHLLHSPDSHSISLNPTFSLDPLLAPSSLDSHHLDPSSSNHLLTAASHGPLDYPFNTPNNHINTRPRNHSSLSLNDHEYLPPSWPTSTISLYSEPILANLPFNYPSSISSDSTDEISTIFVVGFPDDFHDREFQNIFTFSPGFEAASLKLPSCSFPQQLPHHLSLDHFGLPSSSPFDHHHDLLLSSISKKQIIGFAKFTSTYHALRAIQVLNGRRIDPHLNCILKAELAKKNLHTKPTSSFDQLPPLSSAPLSYLEPSSISPFAPDASPHPPLSLPLHHHQTRPPISRPRSLSTQTSFDPFLSNPLSLNNNNNHNNNHNNKLFGAPSDPPFIPPRRATLDSLGPPWTPSISTPNHPRAPIDFNALIATPNPHPSSLYATPPSARTPLISPSWNATPLADQLTPQAPRFPLSLLFPPLHPTTPQPLSSQKFTPNLAPSSDTSSTSTSSRNSLPSSFAHPSAPPPPLVISRTHYPADQNPAINTLYVGGLPTLIIPGPSTIELEDRLCRLFSTVEGFKRFSFRAKNGQPMCFVEFVGIKEACSAMEKLYGHRLGGMVPGGIRLAFSRNALGVRSNHQAPSSQAQQQQQPLLRQAFASFPSQPDTSPHSLAAASSVTLPSNTSLTASGQLACLSTPDISSSLHTATQNPPSSPSTDRLATLLGSSLSMS